MLALMSAGGKDEVDLREMLTYVSAMKALGGEKSSDWKDLMAILVPLLQGNRGKEIDPLALLDMMEEVERGAREEEGERWRALAEALRGRRPPPAEGSGFDGEVGRLVGERLRAALAAEEPRGALEEAEGAMGRPGPLQVLRRGAATTHGTFIQGNYQAPPGYHPRSGCRSRAPDPLEGCAGPLSTDHRTVVQKRYKYSRISRAEDENR